MAIYRLETLFPNQLQARLEACPLLVLPVGTIEWHSHHLPLGLDGLVAEAICEQTADAVDGVLAPVSYWAVGGVPYPYTLKLPAEVIEPLLVAAFEQFGAMGFRVIVAFTGHFGLDHTLTMKRAALAVMERSPVTILAVTPYDLVTDIYQGDHAGTGETSTLWALRPELVQLDAVPPETPLDGIIGPDPRPDASAEKGQEIIKTTVTRTAEVALKLLQHTSALERQDYIEAVRAGVNVLARTSQQRRMLPKREVPSISTPAYLAHCQAIYQGDYRAARSHAERKFADLAA
jgi:creatinine amidohydrolase